MVVIVVMAFMIVAGMVVSFSRGRFRGSESLFSGGQSDAFQGVLGRSELPLMRLARTGPPLSHCTPKDTSLSQQGQTGYGQRFPPTHN